MVGDASVFSFVDGAGSCFVAGAESGDAGFDVCCVGFGASPELGVDDVVGRVGRPARSKAKVGHPSLCCRHKQHCGMQVGSVWCAGPPSPFWVWALASAAPSTGTAPEMARAGVHGPKRRDKAPNRVPALPPASIPTAM
jgi:hypothetical protein